jgi:glucosylceramidase
MKNILLVILGALTPVAMGASVSTCLTILNDQGRVVPDHNHHVHSEDCYKRTWERISKTDLTSELVVDRDIQFQEIDGYGAALTDSSAMLLLELSAASRKKVLQELFSEEGLGLRIVRFELGSSDYSQKIISCDDPPDGMTSDHDLKYFSLSRCTERTLPLLKENLKINPKIKIVVSPWSAPSWMKTTHSMIAGRLEPKFYGDYASYIVRFLKEMKSQGVDVQYLTITNEPIYPQNSHMLSMNMSWQEQDELIKHHLGPALEAARKITGPVELLVFDHNAKDFEYSLNILKDPAARKYVGGTAFHCYEGSAQLFANVRSAFPDKDLLLTECSLGFWLNSFSNAMEYGSRDLVIRNFENGGKALLLWNLALDLKGFPTNQPESFVRGLVTIQKDLKRENVSDWDIPHYFDLAGQGQVRKEPEYYLFSHLSKIIKAGAHRIATTYVQPALFWHEYMGQHNSPDLESVAFENPDHSIGVFLLNGSMSGTLDFRVRTSTQCEHMSLPPKSVASLLLKP